MESVVQEFGQNWVIQLVSTNVKAFNWKEVRQGNGIIGRIISSPVDVDAGIELGALVPLHIDLSTWTLSVSCSGLPHRVTIGFIPETDSLGKSYHLLWPRQGGMHATCCSSRESQSPSQVPGVGRQTAGNEWQGSGTACGTRNITVTILKMQSTT